MYVYLYKKCQIVFQSTCAVLHSQQHCVRIPVLVALHLLMKSLAFGIFHGFDFFSLIAILIRLKYLIVALTFSINIVDYLFLV